MNNNMFSFESQNKEKNIFDFKKKFGFNYDIEGVINLENRKKTEKLLNALDNKDAQTLKNAISSSSLTTQQIFDTAIMGLSRKVLKQQQSLRVQKTIEFKSVNSEGRVEYAIKDTDFASNFSEEKAPEFAFLPKGNIKRVARNIRRELDYTDGIQDNTSYNATVQSTVEGQFSLEEFKIKNIARIIEHDLSVQNFVEARNRLIQSGVGLSQVEDVFAATLQSKISLYSEEYMSRFLDFLTFGGNGETGLVNDTAVTDISADPRSLTFAALTAGLTNATVSADILNYVSMLVNNADSIQFNGLNRLKKVRILFPLKFYPLFIHTGVRFSDLLKDLKGATMIDAIYKSFALAGYTPEDIEISFTNVFDSTDNINATKTGLDIVYMDDSSEAYNMFYHSVLPFELFTPYGGLNSPTNTSNGYSYNYLMASQFSGLINLKPEKRYIIKKAVS